MGDKIHVLLIDDELDFLEVISSWLSSKGYETSNARNGKEAISVIKSSRPDIVFVDFRMPIMDGIETLVNIRKFDKEIPVIMLTAHGDKKRLKKAKKLGASGFFHKGDDITKLEIMIESVLRAHKNINPRDSADDKQDLRKI